MPTAHISAQKGDFAATVLMPGDPLRSKFVAENFLTDAVLVNNLRGIQGYTGTYKGMKISVMASGMGMPSMGIYSYELFKFYDVENIIRIGSAGALSRDLHLYDIVAAMGACTNSAYMSQYNLGGTFAPVASYKLLKNCDLTAEKLGINLNVGNVFTSDIFYNDDDKINEGWQKMGVLAVEMETAALYANAARLGKNALTICTISDCPFSGEETTGEEREKSFTKMMELALETALKA